jgi:hypothetical protein
MADEGIMDDKDDVEGHHTAKEVAEPGQDDLGRHILKTEDEDDVEGHKLIMKIGDPRDDRPGMRTVMESDDKDDVEGHSRIL